MQFKQQEHGYSDKYNITTLPPQAKEIARFAQDADAIQHKQLKSLYLPPEIPNGVLNTTTKVFRDMQTFVSGFLYRPMMT